MNRKVAQRLLCKHYLADTAASGEEAIKMLLAGGSHFDLILLDIHMPYEDGFDVIRKLKADDRLKEIPVIFLTADDDQNAETEGFKAGAKILKDITEMPGIEKGTRWHHERYDGKGYLDGIKGEEIPVFSRIICVADAYDAMTSQRSYRDVLPQEKVRDEIVKGRGTQFDPVFADIMISLIDEDKGYKMRE